MRLGTRRRAEWTSRPMEALGDLADKGVVCAILDRPDKAAQR